ncbi:MFS transporter [Solwaraspora sp. WMMB762]|uniref:MFS transporter n=1 Tax=Solwaraspora sp. WMMB762 TaxID=3404120 RepID=UPI003B933A0B
MNRVRTWAALGFACVAVGLSTAMASPYLTLFLDDAVRASAGQIALCLVAAPVSAVVIATVAGRLSDRLPSRRWLLVAAASAGCLSSALTSVVRDFPVFLLITVTLTASAQVMVPQMFAYAREALAGSARIAMAMSTFRTLFSVAWVAGPPLASLLLTTGGFRLTYAASAVVYAVAAGVVLLAFRHRRRPDVGEVRDTQRYGADASRRTIWLSVAAFVLTWSASNLAIQALPLHVTRELGSGVGTAGLLLGLCAGLEIPLILGFGWLSTRLPVHRLLLVGAGCGAAYMTVVAVSDQVWPLLVGQLLNAASIAALGGLGITYMQDMLPRHQGRASTLYSNAIPTGALLAGPVLGAAQHAGYRMPYAVGALLYVGTLGLLLLARRRPDPVVPVTQ